LEALWNIPEAIEKKNERRITIYYREQHIND
jgi:hypothetical protein